MRNLTRTILLLSLIVAVPALAARHRAVASPNAPVLYTASVVDATNGKPVVGATVANGKTTTVTKADGSFTIPVYIGSQTTLVIKRTGYGTTTATFVYQGGPGVTIQMQPTATVTVVTTSGKTIQLDADSVQFAYAQPLLTEIHSPTGRFCANGTELDVDTSQLSKILGPAAKSAGGACCNLQVDWFDIVLKDGTRQHVSLVFDCYTYYCFIGGKDHTTFQDAYFSFEDIKEVTFP